MSTKRCNSCALAAARAAADHNDLFLFQSRMQNRIQLICSLCIDCAALTAGIQVYFYATSIVTADARTDLIKLLPRNFIYNIRICKARSSKTDHITFSRTNRFRSKLRVIHISGNDNRNIYRCFYLCCRVQIKTIFLVNRRMIPIVGIIAAKVNIQRIVSGFLQIFCSLDALRKIAANLHKLFAFHSAVQDSLHHMFRRVTDRYREVFSTTFLDRLDDFHCKTVTVFKAATVFIRSVVPELCAELVKKVSFMNGMDFNSIYSALLEEFCSLSEFADDRLDLRRCHFFVDQIWLPAVWHFRRADCSADTTWIVTAASITGTKLYKELASVCMDALSHFIVLLHCKPLVCLRCAHQSMLNDPLHFIINVANACQYQADSALRTANKIFDACVCRNALFIDQTKVCHRAHDISVFDLHTANLDRLK